MPVSPSRQPFFTCLFITSFCLGKKFTKPSFPWRQILFSKYEKSSLYADKFYVTSYKIIFKP